MKEPQRKNTEIGNMSPGVKAKTEEVEKGKISTMQMTKQYLRQIFRHRYTSKFHATA